MYRSKLLAIITVALFAALIIPGFMLLIGTFLFPSIGHSTFTFFQFVSSSYAQGLIFNTFEFSIPEAAIAVAVATCYAWLVARTDVPAKRLFELIPILGLTLPGVVAAFVWSFLFAPAFGPANVIIRDIFGPHALVLNVFSMPGMILTAAATGLPLPFLIIYPAMRSLDASMEDASQISGASFLSTFRKVTLPLVMPAVLAAFLLTVIGAVNNFDLPFVIGVPANIHVIATEMYYWAAERAPPAYGSAGSIAILYMILGVCLVTAYLYSTRRMYKYVSVTGKSSLRMVHKLGKWRYAAAFACFLAIFFALILPLGTLVINSMTSVFTFAGGLTIQWNFPTSYVQALQLSNFWPSLGQTIEFSLGAGLSATAIGIVLSYATYRNKTRGARWAEYVSSVPLVLPALVYTLGLFWMFLIVPGFDSIYGTIWPMVISLAFLRMPQSTRIISGNLVQLSNELEEASQMAGATLMRTSTRIVVPLLRVAVVNAFIFGFAESLRELGGVIILSTPNSEAFTALLLDLYDSQPAAFGILSAGSLILTGIIAAVLAVYGVSQYVLGRRRGNRF